MIKITGITHNDYIRFNMQYTGSNDLEDDIGDLDLESLSNGDLPVT